MLQLVTIAALSLLFKLPFNLFISGEECPWSYYPHSSEVTACETAYIGTRFAKKFFKFFKFLNAYGKPYGWFFKFLAMLFFNFNAYGKPYGWYPRRKKREKENRQSTM